MAFYGSFVIDVTDVTNDSYVINESNVINDINESYVINDNNVINVIPVSNVNY